MGFKKTKKRTKKAKQNLTAVDKTLSSIVTGYTGLKLGTTFIKALK